MARNIKQQLDLCAGLWTEEQANTAMRQTTPEKQIASLIGELGSEFMREVAKGDTMSKVFADRESMLKAQTIELNHSREHIRYDSELRVMGN